MCYYLKALNTRIAPLIHDKIREQLCVRVYTSLVELLRISRVRLTRVGAVTGSKGRTGSDEGRGITVVNDSALLLVVDEKLPESVESVPAVPWLDVAPELSVPMGVVNELSLLLIP